MTNREKFAESMAGLSLIFDKEINKALVQIYWNVLREFSDDDVYDAIQRAVRECRFFPKPAELIDFITGSREIRAALAWADVRRAIVEHGSHRSVRFKDLAIHSVLEAMGGWGEMCRLPERELRFREREFRQLYDVYSRRSIDRSAYLLEGEVDARGYAPDALVDHEET